MRTLTQLFILLAVLALAAVGCGRASQAGGDHDHGRASHGDHEGDHEHGGDDGPDPISVTLLTPKVLLFMEYPLLVKDEPAKFLAHFTVLATGEPIRSGRLTFEMRPPGGQPVSLTLDAPRRDGLFVPEWKPEAAGQYTLRLLLDSPQVQETADVGALIVHASRHDAEHAGEVAAEDDPPDLVPFLLEQQWKIGLLQEPVSKRTLVRRLPIPAQIVAPQGASAVVSPPVAGRLLPPPEGRLPRIGDRVEAGQVLATVEPPLPVTDVAQLSANRAWLKTLQIELAQRELEMEMKGLEVERSILQAEARLDFARRALARVSELHGKGIESGQQYDEARQNLRLAEAEHQAAQAMKH
ncbi:MAG: hypothetical protein ACE5HE_03175 [Phycisphaerae bacterium]